LVFTLCIRTPASINEGSVMKLQALLAGVVLASAFSSASALDVATGNNPQPNQANLLRNTCDAGIGAASGLTVFGCLNSDHALPVPLSSDESLEISGGQARLGATVDLFSQLTISLNNLSALILDIRASENGFVTFTDGAGITSSASALSKNGQNFFTLTGITGNSLTFNTTLTIGGAETDIVEDVRQIRLVQQVTAIPEPETYALMMAGLAAIGFIARRRKTQK
jgi:hypothetical protein